MATREKRWGHIPPDLKKVYVRLLLADGYTRDAIGVFFGTSKNAIVGFQHAHLADLTGMTVGTKRSVTRARLEQLLKEDTEKDHSRHDGVEMAVGSAEVPEASGKSDPTPVSRKLTTDWRIACKHSEGCGYLALPGSTTCGRPGHDH